MAINLEKLQELIASLSKDQKRLVREGLAEGGNIDAAMLTETLSSTTNQQAFSKLVLASGDAGVSDAGAPDGGSSTPVPHDPPLTRW